MGYSYAELRPHLISLGNNGELQPGGDYGTSRADVEHLLQTEIPQRIAGEGHRHLLLYAHGGLVNERTAVQRIADYRSALLAAGVFPLSFIWHTDYWSRTLSRPRRAFLHSARVSHCSAWSAVCARMPICKRCSKVRMPST